MEVLGTLDLACERARVRGKIRDGRETNKEM